ncbi:unnamed protein product [Somion occarium]|uniref:HTH La-type RNA-binding domain-containing protein n=1 Tax=Somion occarium TaxID=3059160 RepID=A0ABP1DMJ6_9APHY
MFLDYLQNLRGKQLNGHKALLPPAEQVKTPQRSPAPHSKDLEDWPTVGMSIVTPPLGQRHSSNGGTGVVGGLDISKSEDLRELLTTAPKKGDKQKWITIPPEELQAVADAQRQQNRTQLHARSRSQFQNQQSGGHGSSSGSASGSASISGPNSQRQSRTHSTTRVQQSVSHSSSVAHSQPHSRTGSVNSSPRQPSVRGGRRLPDDRAGGSANRSARSSRATSPQRQMRSQPNPSALPPSQAAIPLPASIEAEANQPEPFSPPQGPAYPEPVPGFPYYPPLPSSTGATRTHSYQSTRATNSPTSHPYGLPNAYPSSPPTYPPPFPGPAPYALYQPYPYAYGPPYVPWGAGPEAPHHLYAPGSVQAPIPVLYPQPAVDPTSPEASAGVPPATMVSRPPPPGESDAVAGYRDVGFVLPPPASYLGQSQTSQEEQKEERAKQISFGSIGLANSQSPPLSQSSPPAPNTAANSGNLGGLGLDVNSKRDDSSVSNPEENELGIEKPFTAFTIGVTPENAGPSRSRSRTTPQTKSSAPSRDRMETAPAVLSSASIASASGSASILAESTGLMSAEDQKVIDLTESHTRFEFGTASALQDVPTQSSTLEASDTQQGSVTNVVPSSATSLNGGSPPNVPSPVDNVSPQHLQEQSYRQPIPISPRVDLPPLAPLGVPMVVSPTSSTSAYPPNAIPPMTSPPQSSDEFQVRNYGYGFGRGGMVPGVPPPGPPVLSEEQRDMPPRDYQPSHGGRPRRGSYGGGYGYERGGHSMRRGRGGYGGGRGGRNFPRGAGGGSFQQHQQNQQGKPPFTVVPPPHLPPMSDSAGYYPSSVPQPQISGTTYFHPAAYDPYFGSYPQPPPQLMIPPPSQTVGPPFPSPLTRTSFPLDPLRHQLLGQLEYYLSTQNLLKDFFLRQRMDSRGWISISLIASFNRVKQLTADVQLVRDVLSLSSLVEVRDNNVRIHEWRRYILPTAPQSVVEEAPIPPEHENIPADPAGFNDPPADEASSRHDEEAEDDEDVETEEDDVEFVLGGDANRSWTAERASG